MLGWLENLAPEEVPKPWMWHLEHELEPWFDDVRRSRESKYSGGGGESREEVPMMQNAMTKNYRRD